MSRQHLAAALVCGACAFMASAPASAYCRTNSCDEKRGEDCSTDENGCLVGAIPLAWSSSCITFSVQSAGSVKNDIDAVAFEQVITDAFATWMNADCGDGQHPSIAVNFLGQVSCGTVEYNRDQGNANIYVFRDEEWEETAPENALALTTVWYDWKTGEIYDADVEVNGTKGDITNGAPEDGADLPSIITHESGHFLGLAHSNRLSSTMYSEYAPTKGNLRRLATDDVSGICEIYPPDRRAKTEDCTPRHGFSSTCSVDKSDSGCTLAAAPNPSGHRGLALSALFGLVGTSLLRRRRRR